MEWHWPALSIQQPWADLIVAGRKTIEVRSWQTAHRGPFWIHASRKENITLEHRFGIERPFRGGFIGCATLVGMVELDEGRWTRWRERHLVDGSAPQKAWGWLLRDCVRLPSPVPAPGTLGL